MTFRDDHDAALARADALEDEVERTKRERDALAAKVAELERNAKPAAEKKKQRAASESSSEEPSSDTKGEKRAAIGAVVGTLVLFGIMAGFGMRESCTHKREHDAWQQQSDARTAHEKRWRALVSVEPCVRRIAWGSMSVRGSTPEKLDPRTAGVYYTAGQATANCYGRGSELLSDPKTSATIKAALGAWIDLQRKLELAAKPVDAYYSNGDWKEDNFAAAPALWKPVLVLIAQQAPTLEMLRRDVLPALREEMRAIIKQHEATSGRDEVYWRAALTVALYELADRGYAASGIYAGTPPDLAAAAKALQQPVVQFLALVKQAPIEVRRDLRKLDWILEPFAAGEYSRAETPLWHLSNGEADLLNGRSAIPGLPPDPGKEPEQSSD